MGTQDSEEFKNALKDIASHAHQLDSPFGNVFYQLCIHLFVLQNIL